VCSTYKAYAGKKENGAEREINDYLFDVAHARLSVHEIDCANDEPGNAENSKDNAYDPFLHNSFFSYACKRYAPLNLFSLRACWFL
jgi:hypothetical protein